MVFATEFLQITSSYVKTLTTKRIENRMKSEMEIVKRQYEKGYSFRLAWIGEGLLLISLIITIAETYLVKKGKVDTYNRFHNKQRTTSGVI